jgi:hypothetical protein
MLATFVLALLLLLNHEKPEIAGILEGNQSLGVSLAVK